jgi:hypothetical protein
LEFKNLANYGKQAEVCNQAEQGSNTGEEALSWPLKEDWWRRHHKAARVQEDQPSRTSDDRYQLRRQYISHQECTGGLLPEGARPKIFIDGKYQDEIIVTYDADQLSEKNDPLGLNKARIIGKVKQADIDNHSYEKSKAKLCGIITSMTTMEVYEKLSIHRSHQTSGSSIMASSATASATTNTPPTGTVFINCPLSLWKDVVHVITTKTVGDKRIDQDKVTVDFAAMR